MKMGETKLRTITALIVIPFVVACFFSYSSVIGLVSAVVLLANYELLRMALGNHQNVVLRSGITLITTFSSIMFGYLGKDMIYVFSIYTFSSFLIIVFSLFVGREENFGKNSIWGIFGLYYISFNLSMFFPIYRFYGPMNAVFILTVTWIFDSSAYFVGIKFGKTKIGGKISPNKSLEGILGGIVGSFAYTILFGFISKKFFNEEIMSIWEAMFFSIALSIFCTFGDLFESSIKRLFGFKDSGAILPGHGGMLDRIDGLLFSAPGYLLFLLLMRGSRIIW